MTDAELLELSQCTEEELLNGLGRTLSDGRLGISPSDYYERGKVWVDARRGEICRWLAERPGTRQLIEDGWAARRMEGLGALYDLLALANGQPTAGWAMVFILRVGLAEFCSDCKPS